MSSEIGDKIYLITNGIEILCDSCYNKLSHQSSCSMRGLKCHKIYFPKEGGWDAQCIPAFVYLSSIPACMIGLTGYAITTHNTKSCTISNPNMTDNAMSKPVLPECPLRRPFLHAFFTTLRTQRFLRSCSARRKTLPQAFARSSAYGCSVQTVQPSTTSTSCCLPSPNTGSTLPSSA